MEKIDITRDFIKEEAEKFGANNEKEYIKSYVERNNTGEEALKDNGAYFGFIHPDEESSGPYHDFSFVIFPTDKEDKAWLVCLGIGSLGFKNDYELSTIPGLRRIFSKLVDNNGFCKSDFSDIETGLPRELRNNPKLSHIKNSISRYSKVLPVCQIVDDPLSDKGKEVISAFLAGYAKLREWPTNSNHRSAINNALEKFSENVQTNEMEEVFDLINERRYVVLQGPPGTGKTRLAKQIAEHLDARTYFTQFHAETTYSDFIYGIRPSINSDQLTYKDKPGIFTEAVKYAIETGEDTVLIIDEINRANLSNVLGPIFYLFEYKQDFAEVEINISPDLSIKTLPNNFYVIATMNTADRSLAVVDFALRRRFAWYTLHPKKIHSKEFFDNDFSIFDEIFNWYATPNELNLQPGQGYFIAPSEEIMKMRIQYEIFPLIKEYLQEGLLLSAKEEFNNYFDSRINKSLFE